jgi:DNA-binding Lrp family transcriptional regulator
MPFSLTDSIVAILKGLLKDGRKSFRQISRETGIGTPLSAARYHRWWLR